jgi:hypothetical protein
MANQDAVTPSELESGLLPQRQPASPFARRGSIYRSAGVLASISSTISMFLCWYCSSFRFPEGVVSPPVSFTVFLPPEKYFWTLGCIITSAFGVCVAHQFITLTLTSKSIWRFIAIICLSFALIGLLVQSIIPLQSDMWRMLTDPKHFEIQMVTLIHLMSASLFFLGSYSFAFFSFLALVRSRAIPLQAMRLKLFILVVLMLCIIGFGLSEHDQIKLNKVDLINSEGIEQRVIIFIISLYYASFTYDIIQLEKT